MEKITINKPSKTTKTSAVLQKVSSGKFLEAFIDSKKQTLSNKKGLTAQGVVNLRNETCHILSHCNPHNATNSPETTHLVVGYVQSGKTMSFTALTALALDNGYRIIIYLAGTKNNLLDQTSTRLRKDLINSDYRNNCYYKIHADPTTSDAEDIIGHLESSDKPIILIPILKHYSHIKNITQLFKTQELQEFLKEESVIIIDDEADQASLNSNGRKNSQNDEDQKSETYDSILKLRACLPGNSYVQYTATPQANLLISIQDILSPKSHTLLTPGEDYIGGKKFFGKDIDHQLFNGQLILSIPQDEVFHKRRNPLKRMPKSLKDALMFHILAVAIVIKWAKTEGIPFLSMMVHPDETKKWNKTFKNWIETELKNWRKSLKEPGQTIDKVALIDNFKRIFPSAIQFYEDSEKPNFEDILPLIPDVLSDKKVYLVNTDKEAQTDIDWSNCIMHILVGAEMLNRGFTVENLATTYMPRYSTSATNADTIQQRCRFFGYKKPYIKSCRVFLPEISIANYYDYIEHEEELRSTLASCDTLKEAEHKILLSPRLRPTRLNILPVSVVNLKLKGMHGLQAFSTSALIKANTLLVEDFLKENEQNFSTNPITEFKLDYNTEDRTHRGFKLPIDKAIEFLDAFRFGNYKDARRKADTIRYLRYLSSSPNFNLKFVYFVQMAYNAKETRERNFDDTNMQLAPNTDIFAGPSSAKDSTNYPGDRKIVGNDTITIQLHKIKFKNITIDIENPAYTLAINYPEKLAVNYCSNEEIKNEYDLEETD